MHDYSVMSDFCIPMDCCPPGSSVQGIFQARIPEWVAISSSKGFSRFKEQIPVSCGSCIAGGFFTTEPPPAKPINPAAAAAVAAAKP